MDTIQKIDLLSKKEITLTNASDLRAWADRLNVTAVKLRAAINAVGADPKEVEAYLARKK